MLRRSHQQPKKVNMDATKSSIRALLAQYNYRRARVIEGLQEYDLIGRYDPNSLPKEIVVAGLEKMTQTELNELHASISSCFDQLQIQACSINEDYRRGVEEQIKKESIPLNVTEMLQARGVGLTTVVGSGAAKELVSKIATQTINKALQSAKTNKMSPSSSATTSSVSASVAKNKKTKPAAQRVETPQEVVPANIGTANTYSFARLQVLIENENAEIQSFNAWLVSVKSRMESLVLQGLKPLDVLPLLKNDSNRTEVEQALAIATQKREEAQKVLAHHIDCFNELQRAEKKRQKQKEKEEQEQKQQQKLLEQQRILAERQVAEIIVEPVPVAVPVKQPLAYDPFNAVDFVAYKKEETVNRPSVKSSKAPKNKTEVMVINPEQLHLLPLLEEINAINNQFKAYLNYSEKQQKSGIFDAQSAIYLCGVERKLLKLYEKLLVNSQSAESSHIFDSVDSSAKCRNIAKYLYNDFLFNHSSSNIQSFVTFTASTLHERLTAKLYSKPFDLIAMQDIPSVLQQSLTENNKQADLALMDARYKSMLNIIHALNRKNEENVTNDLVYKKPGQELTRALFFCLALAGLMTKHAFLPVQYSKAIEDSIGEAGLGNSSRLFANSSNKKLTRLLTYLEKIVATDKNKAKVLIEKLSAVDMAKLLVEICNLESHATFGAWLSMKPEIIDLILCISQKFEELHTLRGDCCFSYANHSGLSQFAKGEAMKLMEQMKNTPFSAMAKTDPFFERMQLVIRLMSEQNFMTAQSEAEPLLANDGNAFVTFSNRYLWGQAAQVVAKTRQCLEELFGEKKDVSLNVSMRSVL